MFSEPEFWVAVAFVIPMGCSPIGVHRTVLSARSPPRPDQGRTRRAPAASDGPPSCWPSTRPPHASAEREAQDIISVPGPRPSGLPRRPRSSWKISSSGAQDRREQDRAGRSPGDRRRAGGGGQRRGCRGIDHSVEIGKRGSRRRVAGQGHRRSPRQAELIDESFKLKSRRDDFAPAFCFDERMSRRSGSGSTASWEMTPPISSSSPSSPSVRASRPADRSRYRTHRSRRHCRPAPDRPRLPPPG